MARRQLRMKKGITTRAYASNRMFAGKHPKRYGFTRRPYWTWGDL